MFSVDLLSAALPHLSADPLDAPPTDWIQHLGDSASKAATQHIQTNLPELQAVDPQQPPKAYAASDQTIPTTPSLGDTSHSQVAIPVDLVTATDATPDLKLEKTQHQNKPTEPEVNDASSADALIDDEANNGVELLEHHVEYVFVDSAVEDSSTLLSNLRDNGVDDTDWRIVFLDADTDGVDQITDALINVSGVDAIHLISHGQDGAINLGSTALNTDTLYQYGADVWAWGQSLSEDADLLIYGCDLASTQAGKDLIEELAQECDCDVAASEDPTGHQALGGDWDLEYQSGDISTDIAFNRVAQQTWQGTLDITSDLVIHQRFDANAQDSSGNNNDGTLTGGATIDTTPASNQVGDGKLGLDGVDDYVDMSAHVSALQPLAEGTIAAWVNLNSSGDYVVFEASDSGEANSRVALSVYSDGSVEFIVNQDPGPATLNLYTGAGVVPSDNTWTHIAVTTDATGNTLFINGTEELSVLYDQGSATTSAFFSSVSTIDFASWGVGKHSTSNFAEYLDGFIDDGRIYDRALSASDIAELYTYNPIPTDTIDVTTTNDTITVGADTSSLEALAADDGGGDGVSLREAITASNNQGGDNNINFDIAGAGPHVINITGSVLPAITTPTAIDGTTDTDYITNGNAPIVVLDGNNQAGDAINITATAANSSISGLVIRDFGGNAIDIDAGADNVTISGNYLGSYDTNGALLAGEEFSDTIIFSEGDGIAIGGSSGSQGNLVGGGLRGIHLNSTSGGDISGNYIGTDITGNSTVSITFHGILLDDGTNGVTVGGASAAHSNIIAGVGGQSITILGEDSDSNAIYNNRIGLGADGSTLLGSGTIAISIQNADFTVIGGASSGNTIVDGIGGVSFGLLLTGSVNGSTVQGNTIGIDQTGTVSGGFSVHGIYLAADTNNNTIGGENSGEGNTISGNGESGIFLDSAAGTSNALRGNAIYDNGTIGIDIDPTGANYNDNLDTDLGPNERQNHAIISSGSILDDGTFFYDLNTSSLAAGTYTIDFFASSNRDDTGAEGERFVGAVSGVAGGSNSVVGSLSGITVTPGEYLTLVTTDSAGNSSEFSPYAVVVDGDTGGTAPYDLFVSSSATTGLLLNNTGDDSYLIADDGSAILSGRNSLTVELQFESDNSGQFTPLLSYNTSSSNNELLIYIDSSGRLNALINNSVISSSGIDYQALLNGERQNLALTWDSNGGLWQIYHNGILVDSTALDGGSQLLANGSSMDPGGALIFGQNQNELAAGFSPSQIFSGSLYNVRIFDNVRTNIELLATHQDTVPFDERGLIAQWNFNRISADNIIIDSVEGNNLTLQHTTEPSFIADSPGLLLSTNQNVLDDTIVGTITGSDIERDAKIAELLAADPLLRHNPETNKFYLLVETASSWTDAQVYASTQTLNGSPAGQLATIRSAEENTFLMTIAAQTDALLWIGGSDASTDDEWFWQGLSGDEDQFWQGDDTGYNSGSTYNNWETGKPDDGSGNEYAITIDQNGTWDDQRNNLLYSSLIEWDADDVLSTTSSLSYVLQSQTVANAFSIHPTSGVVTVANSLLLDVDTNPSHTLTVDVTDTDGNSYTSDFLVTLKGLELPSNNPPSDLSTGIEINTDTGNNAYLYSTEGNEILGGLDAFTLETTVQFSGTPEQPFSTLVRYSATGSVSGDSVTLLADNNGKLALSIENTLVTSSVAVTKLFNGQAHHIAASWDNSAGEVSFYVNGKLLDRQTGLHTGLLTNDGGGEGTLYVGQYANGAVDPGFENFHFSGTSYELRIWNTLRSETEIALNHQHLLDLTPTEATTTGLLAHWQMNGLTLDDQVADTVNGKNLSIGNVSNSAGFTYSAPGQSLSVNEQIANGTSVGFVRPLDSDEFQDVVSDGLFLATNPTGSNQYNSASTFGSWTVESGSIAVEGGFTDNAPLGGAAVDLDGGSPGAISQTLTTEPGIEYTVLFALSGNFSATASKELRVSAAGEFTDFSIDYDPAWSFSNLLWQQRAFTFVAQESTTKLLFSSLSDYGSTGAVISDVRVTAVPNAVTEILRNDSTLHYNAADQKFYQISQFAAQWNNAQANSNTVEINKIPGKLVRISSDSENSFIQNLLQANGLARTWIAASDDSVEGSWVWQDSTAETFYTGGAAVDGQYENFGDSEPSGGTADNYLTLEASTGDWSDENANSLYSYITEWSAADVLSNYTYQLTNTADGRFAIDSATGEISVSDGTALRYADNTSHDITAQVTDPSGSIYSKVVTVQVNDRSPVNLNVTSTATAGLSINTDGGDDAYLIADNGDSILGGTTAFTVETQFSTVSTASELPILSYVSAPSNTELLFALNSDGTFKVIISGSEITSNAVDFNTLRDGINHSIAVSWDGSTGDLNIHVDGSIVDTLSNVATGTSISADGTLIFGQQQSTVAGGFDPSQTFKGTLHNIRIFSDIRTSAEIANSHQSALPHDTGNLLAQWNFNNRSVNNFIEDSVSGNHLALRHTSQSGFTENSPQLILAINENSPTGTLVGDVSAEDRDRTQLIADILASDANLYYSELSRTFYQYVDTGQSWSDANLNAQATTLNGISGVMAFATSAEQNQLLADILNSRGASDAYIRASDNAQEGEWRSGEQLTDTQFWQGDSTGSATPDAYSNWSSDNPNDSGGQNYAKLTAATGQWDDVVSTGLLKSFIQYDADTVLDNAGPIGQQSLTYSIASQTVAGAFSIDTATGSIVVADTLLIDYEVNTNHALTVRATDVDGNTVDRDITISISNQLETTSVSTDLSSGIELNSDGGNDTYLISNNASAIVGGLSELTIESTVAVDDRGQQLILSYSTSTYNDALKLQLIDEDLRLSISNTLIDLSALNYNSAISDGQVHHLAVSWDNSNGDVRVFLDGDFVDSATGFATGLTIDADASNALALGMNTDSPTGLFDSTQTFRGILYDLKLWGETKSEIELALNQYAKIDGGNLPAGLIANWQMDGFNGSDQVEDIVNGIDLSVGHALGTGFLFSTPANALNIDDNSYTGSSVGFVLPSVTGYNHDISTDGLFTEAGGTASSTDYTEGQTFGGWSVDAGGITVQRTVFETPPSGGFSVELSATQPAAISQTLSTEPGQQYQVIFASSGNWSSGSDVKPLSVSVDGQATDLLAKKPINWATDNMLWEQRAITFTATSSETHLQFSSPVAGSSGPVIGDIKVTEVPNAVSTLLSKVSGLSFDAATGKFYRFISAPEYFNLALNVATTTLLNNVSGQLATVQSNAGNEILQQFAIESGSSVWLGASDASNEGEWNWLQGSDESTDKFWTGGSGGTNIAGTFTERMNLSDSPGENYLRLLESGQWADAPNDTGQPFVIEWDAAEVLGGYTYALTDTADLFKINTMTGEITVKNGSGLDYESNQSHTVSVEVTNAIGATYTETLTIQVNDSGAQLAQTIPIAQSINEDAALVFSTANANAITVTDNGPDNALLQVTLEVNNGILTLYQTDDLTFIEGFDAARSMILEGSETAINAALDGIQYTPDPDYNGSDQLTITTSLTANMQSHYSFDVDGSDDSAGPADNGTLQNGASIVDDAERGSVLSLDGINHFFDSTADVGQPASATLATWVNANNSNADVISIDGEFTIRIDDASAGGFVNVFYYDGTSYNQATSNQAIAGSGWHHVAASFNDVSKTLKLYIDGIEVASNTYTTSIDYTALPTNKVFIGSSNGTSAFIDGMVDDSRIYNRALTPDEIQSLAANNTPQTIGPDATQTYAVPAGDNTAQRALFIHDSFKPFNTDGVITTLKIASDNDATPINFDFLVFRPDSNGDYEVIHRVPLTDADVLSTITGIRTLDIGTLEIAAGDVFGHWSGVSGGSIPYDPNTSGGATGWSFYNSVSLDPGSIVQANTGNGNDRVYAIAVEFQPDLKPEPQVTGNVPLSISPINDAPVIATSIGPGTHTEGSTSTAFDSNLTITDLDSADFSGGVMTTTLVANGETTDHLLVADGNNVTLVTNTVNYDFGSGPIAIGAVSGGDGINPLEITFNSAANQVSVEATGQQVSFRTESDTPSELPRSVNMTVSDGDGGTSLTVTRTIDVVATNDSPTLSTIEPTILNYTENSGLIPVTTALLITDVDSVDLSSATISFIAGYNSGEDSLTFLNQNGITGVYDALSGVLTLTGNATLAQYEAALHSISYSNNSDNPDTAIRTVGFMVNDGAADSNTQTRHISITPSNDAPLTASIESSAISYFENDPAVSITNTLTVSDVDNDTLSGATISISGGFQINEDLLAFNSMANITGSWDAATGLLTLNGLDSVANYQAALRSIIYENSSENPNISNRTVSFAVADAGAPSNSETRDIVVLRSNDAPVQSAIESTPIQYTEGNGPVTVTSTLAISDPDDTLINSALIGITSNYQSGEDVLGFNNQNGITGVYNGIDGSWALSGSSSLANYQAALQSITYENTSENPLSATRVVSFSVSDSFLNSTTVTRSINIGAVNDSPILGSIELPPNSYTENDAPLPVTTTITVADSDDQFIQSAQIQISSGFTAGEDNLTFVDQNGITGNYDDTTGILALTGTAPSNDYQTALRSVGYLNTSEDPNAFTRTISYQINDLASTSNLQLRDIDFTAVNDIPINASLETAPLIYTENDSPVPITTTLTINDVDDTHLESASVLIDTNYVSSEDQLGFINQFGISGSFNVATGELTLSGTSLVTNYEAAIRTITYTNTSDNPDISVRNLTITVRDSNDNSASLNREISIIAANDAPVLNSIETDAITYAENDPLLLVTSTLTVSDRDNTQLPSATVQVSGNFIAAEDELIFTNQNGITGNYDQANGLLSLTGSATLADYQTALQSVTYQNNSDDPDVSTRTISFTVNDGDISGNTLTRDISIVSINDAPILSNIESTQVAYFENTSARVITSDLQIADPDNALIQSATIIISNNFHTAEDIINYVDNNGISGSYDPATGTLTLSGWATPEQYQDALRSVTYQNTSDNPDSSARTIDIRVNDGNGNSNAQTRTVVIIPTNDAPIASSIELTSLNFVENSAAQNITSTLALSELDNVTLASATVTISGNYSPAEDLLAFTNQNGISGSFDQITGELVLSGQASVRDYETAIRNITYTNLSDDPNSAVRIITFTVNDGLTNSATLNRVVTIAPVNDAPTIQSLESVTQSYLENDGPVFLSQSLSLVDLDSPTLVSATVAITAGFAGNQDILSGGVPTGIVTSYDAAIGTLNLNGTATVAEYQTALRNITYTNTSENPTTGSRSVSYTVNDGMIDSTTETRQIDVSRINDAPLQENIETSSLSYTENSLPVNITASLLLTDVDHNSLQFATLSMGPNYVAGEDLLTFTDTPNLTSSWDAATGTLALVGIDTVTAYQDALRSVSYFNTSDNPDTAIRRVFFTVDDGADGSNVLSRDISITAINDAPVKVNIETSPLVFVENSSPLAITNDIVLQELDDTNLEQAIIQITSEFQADQDVLAFTNTFRILGSWNASTGELILSGTDTIAAYQAAIRSVTYVNTSDNPIANNRTVSLTVNDGDASSNTATREVAIIPVNDQPTQTLIESQSLSYIENAFPLAITSSISLSDIDDTHLQSATVYFSSGYAPTEDVLAFTDTGTISSQWNSATGHLTLQGTDTIEAYQAALQSVTYFNTSDNPNQTPRQISFSVGDDNTESNPSVREVLITSVNDKPTSADNTIILLEDNSYTFTLADFPFNDTLDAHQLSGVNLTQLPQNGELLLDGVAISSAQFITAADISSGLLVFNPATNGNGLPYDTLAYSVVDDGGTSNGGADTSLQHTILIDVINVNDAPSGGDNTVLTPEDTDYVFGRSDFRFTDVHDDDEFTAITISALPNQGLLTVWGNAVVVGQVITKAQIASGSFIYSPPDNQAGTGYNGFGFQVHDSGGISNGGISIDPSANFLSFNIPDVNDPPLLISQGATVDEGSDSLIGIDVLAATDADDLLPEELTFQLTQPPIHGELRLNGILLTTGDSFSLAQIAGDNLRYIHDGSETASDEFSVSLADGGEDGALPVTGRFLLIINEVIDPAPELSDDEITLEFGQPFNSVTGDLLTSGTNVLGSGYLQNTNAFTVELDIAPQHGEIELNQDGTFSYVHDGSTFLSDTFSYRVTNEDGVYTIATVEITIEPPIASAFSTSPTAVSQGGMPEDTTETIAETESTPEAENPEDASELFSEVSFEATNAVTSASLNTSTSPELLKTTEIDSTSETALAGDSHEALAVENHNAQRDVTVFQQSLGVSNLSSLSFTVAYEIQRTPSHAVVANPNFLEGLARLESELKESEDEFVSRYTLEGETVFGVSISATAGILAWALRGGALFATVMASTPIWASLDPGRALAAPQSRRGNDEETAADRSVENLFKT